MKKKMITPNPLKGAFKGAGLNNFTVAKSPLGDLGVTMIIKIKKVESYEDKNY